MHCAVWKLQDARLSLLYCSRQGWMSVRLPQSVFCLQGETWHWCCLCAGLHTFGSAVWNGRKHNGRSSQNRSDSDSGQVSCWFHFHLEVEDFFQWAWTTQPNLQCYYCKEIFLCSSFMFFLYVKIALLEGCVHTPNGHHLWLDLWALRTLTDTHHRLVSKVVMFGYTTSNTRRYTRYTHILAGMQSSTMGNWQ